MKKETLLWTQGVDNKGMFSLESGVVVPDSPLYSDLLAKFSQLVRTEKWDYRNNSVRTYYDGTDTIITGFFKERDDAGRRATYTLYHYSKDPQTAISELLRLSDAIHYTIPDGVIDFISTSLQAKAKRIRKNRRLVYIPITLILVVIIAGLLSQTCSANNAFVDRKTVSEATNTKIVYE